MCYNFIHFWFLVHYPSVAKQPSVQVERESVLEALQLKFRYNEGKLVVLFWEFPQRVIELLKQYNLEIFLLAVHVVVPEEHGNAGLKRCSRHVFLCSWVLLTLGSVIFWNWIIGDAAKLKPKYLASTRALEFQNRFNMWCRCWKLREIRGWIWAKQSLFLNRPFRVLLSWVTQR